MKIGRFPNDSSTLHSRNQASPKSQRPNTVRHKRARQTLGLGGTSTYQCWPLHHLWT